MLVPIPSATRLLDLLSLKGKVIVVTGAAGPRGIGLEAARGCAEMGASIALTWSTRKEGAEKNAADIAAEYGVKAKAFRCNVGDYADVERFVEEVLGEFGKIDGFVAKYVWLRLVPGCAHACWKTIVLTTNNV